MLVDLSAGHDAQSGNTDIPIILPEGDLVLDKYVGKGLQAGEVEIPDGSSSSSAPSLPQFDAEAMAQLEGMGFPAVRCQKALLATGNSGAEVAMEWLFGHSLFCSSIDSK